MIQGLYPRRLHTRRSRTPELSRPAIGSESDGADNPSDLAPSICMTNRPGNPWRPILGSEFRCSDKENNTTESDACMGSRSSSTDGSSRRNCVLKLLQEDEQENSSPENFSRQLYRRRHYKIGGTKQNENLEPTSTLCNEEDSDEIENFLCTPAAKRIRMNADSISKPTTAELPQHKLVVHYKEDVLIPVTTRLAQILSDLYGFPDEDSQSFSSILQQQLNTRPSSERRIQAVAEYSRVFASIAAHISHVPRNSSSFKSLVPFYLCHSLLDLYSLLWYSPPLNDVQYPLGLLSPEGLSQILSPHRTVEQILRFVRVFDALPPDETPTAVFQECSIHLTRLMLLCNFNEFAHMTRTFQGLGDRVADMLAEALLVPAKSLSAFRLNLLTPDTHAGFLSDIRDTMRRHVSKLIGTGSEEDLMESSVFGKCLSVLLGDQVHIDRVVHQAFPSCWLSSFVLGLFWRSLDSSHIIKDLCSMLSGTADELGDIVAFFFNSWLEDHASLRSFHQLKPTERPLACVLANDVDQLTECLRTDPTLFISPILINLLNDDHHFIHEEWTTAEVFFRHIAHLQPEQSQVEKIYRCFGILAARRESSAKQLVLSREHALEAPRRRRYAIPADDSDYTPTLQINEDEDMMSSLSRIISNVEPTITDDRDNVEVVNDSLIMCQKSALSVVLTTSLVQLKRSRAPEQFAELENVIDFVIEEEPQSCIADVTQLMAEIAEALVLAAVTRPSLCTVGLRLACRHAALRKDVRCLRMAFDEVQSPTTSPASSPTSSVRPPYQMSKFMQVEQSRVLRNLVVQYKTAATVDSAANKISPTSCPQGGRSRLRSIISTSFWELEKEFGNEEKPLVDTVINKLECLHSPSVCPDIDLDLLVNDLSSAVYSRNLVFLVCLTKYWNSLQEILKRDQVSTIEHQHRLAEAGRTLLHLLCCNYCPPSHLDFTFDVILNCHQQGLLSHKERQQFSSFWVRYVNGMYKSSMGPLPDTLKWNWNSPEGRKGCQFLSRVITETSCTYDSTTIAIPLWERNPQKLWSSRSDLEKWLAYNFQVFGDLI